MGAVHIARSAAPLRLPQGSGVGRGPLLIQHPHKSESSALPTALDLLVLILRKSSCIPEHLRRPPLPTKGGKEARELLGPVQTHATNYTRMELTAATFYLLSQDEPLSLFSEARVKKNR